MRVGCGYDVHPFAKGRPLVLGGVTVPYEMGLAGHSDADALAHAVTDAVLGALGEGDIGSHFPDTDVAYAGADSLQLLAEVTSLMKQRGYTLMNVDSTVIAQAPKLAPHIDAMKKNLARAMGCEPDRVNVKATTHEKLGALGRGEGIAAMAVCLLESKKQ